MRIEFKNRQFKIWKYNVSHSILLIRSPKNDKLNTNFDIIFSGVKMINFPYKFDGNCMTSISEIDDKDIISECEKQGFKLEEVYVFRGEKMKYYIVASIINIDENDNDIFDVKF